MVEMIPRKFARLSSRLAVFATLLFAIGCEKVPLLAPTGSTITLTSATTALPVNGEATIVAQILESSGTPPHSGTRVTFTTTLGTIEPVEASTDVSGRATVTFRAGGASGTAIIAAASGGATTSTGGTSSGGTGGATGGTTSGDRSLRIAVGAAAVGRIVAGASPSTIASRGGTSTITAAVTDINGNPLASVPVIFTTTAGTLSATSVVTDAAGIAVTTLSTSVEATVTASAGLASSGGGSSGGTGGGGSTGGTGASSATVTIKVNPTPTLSVTPATTGTLTAGTPVVFTVTATIPAGSTSQIRDMSIDLGDGNVRPLGAASGTTSVQHIYSNTAAQSFTVTVTLTDTLGEKTSASTVVVVLPQPPLGATIGFSKVGAALPVTVNFTATVTPATATVTSYFWDFGNGASQTTTANTAVQTYTTLGTFTVRVTVTTTTGQTTTGVTAVFIP